MSKKYYVVKNGVTPGIYTNWTDCKKQIDGFPGAIYKGFKSEEEALEFWETGEIKGNSNFKSTEEVLANLVDQEMIAYVDGSNKGDGSEYSWGVVLFSLEKGKQTFNGKSDNPKLISHRNVAGELTGAIKATQFAIDNKASKLTIYHDYAGIRHFALGEWKTNNFLTEAYRDFFRKNKDKIKVDFVKVKGHTGDIFNDEADKLAKSALGLL